MLSHEIIVPDEKGFTVIHWGNTQRNENATHTPCMIPVKNAPTRAEAIIRLRAWIKAGRPHFTSRRFPKIMAPQEEAKEQKPSERVTKTKQPQLVKHHARIVCKTCNGLGEIPGLTSVPNDMIECPTCEGRSY